jgi:hypothetical protein
MQRPEQLVHKTVVQHLRLRGVPGLVFFHVPNGIPGHGRRHHVQGAIARGCARGCGRSDPPVIAMA